MAVGIELDTENSCRKYQVCKPVAPQQNRNRSASVAVFSCFTVIFVCDDLIGFEELNL